MRTTILYIGILLPFIQPQASFGQEQNSVEPPYWVYKDGFVNGTPSGTMGSTEGSSLSMDTLHPVNPASGTHCFQLKANGTEGWSGAYIQHGGDFLKEVSDDHVYPDLSNHKFLVFSARSSQDNYTMGRLGMGEGNNDILQYEGKVALSTQWQRYVIELKKTTTRRSLNGLFVAVFEGAGEVYFDDIYYADQFFKIEATDVVFGERKAPLDPGAFYLYDDQWENGIPSGYMGEKNGVSMKFDFAYRENPFLGPKCIKIIVSKAEIWRGIHIQYTGKWNERLTENDSLPNLQKYDKLVFMARTDGETIVIPEIGMGADTYTEERTFEPYAEVNGEWKKFELDLRGMAREKVNTVFYMVLPVGTFYLDEIRYVSSKDLKEAHEKI